MKHKQAYLKAGAAFICLVLGWWLWQGVEAIRQASSLAGPAAHYVSHSAGETGAANIVAAILFDYRGYDTLGEATVIFTTVTGVAMLFARSKYRKSSTGLSFIVKRGLSFIVPFITMYAAGIVLTGHLTPGGGFQGGAVFATSTILFCIVYGSNFEASRIHPKAKEFAESAGAIIFTVTGLIGLVAGAGFLANASTGFPTGEAGHFLSGGTIPILNIAVGLKVGAGLSTIFYSMVKFLEVKVVAPVGGDET